MSRVKRRGVARVLALGQAGHGHAQWGSWAAPAAAGARVRAAPGPQPPGRGHAAPLAAPERAAPAPCSLCCSCRPPEGAAKRQPVVRPVTIYQLSAPQGSAAPTRARKVQHAGSLGRAWRLARRPAIAGRARAAVARCGGGRPGRSPGFF